MFFNNLSKKLPTIAIHFGACLTASIWIISEVVLCKLGSIFGSSHSGVLLSCGLYIFVAVSSVCLAVFTLCGIKAFETRTRYFLKLADRDGSFFAELTKNLIIGAIKCGNYFIIPLAFIGEVLLYCYGSIEWSRSLSWWMLDIVIASSSACVLVYALLSGAAADRIRDYYFMTIE